MKKVGERKVSGLTNVKKKIGVGKANKKRRRQCECRRRKGKKTRCATRRIDELPDRHDKEVIKK